MHETPEPHWLREDAIISMHARQLAEHGGLEGIRAPELLQSALARPRQMFYYAPPPITLSQLAAAYGFAIARNHPFLDGNKRTAWVAVRSFLLLNGADVDASAQDKYATMIALASGELSEEAFAAWLEAHRIGLSEPI